MLGFNKKEMNTFLKGYNRTMKEARDETCERFRKEHKLMETKQLKIDLPIHIYNVVEELGVDFVFTVIEKACSDYMEDRFSLQILNAEKARAEQLKFIEDSIHKLKEDNDQLKKWVNHLCNKTKEPEEEQGVNLNNEERIQELKENFNKRSIDTARRIVNNRAAIDVMYVEHKENIERLEEKIERLTKIIGTPYVWPDTLTNLEAQKRAAGLH